MNRLIRITAALLLAFPMLATAKITPAEGGFGVTYNVNLRGGTSNGSDIQDVLIFEWDGDGNYSIDGPFTINAQGRSLLSHVTEFAPSSALVMGWGAGVPGIGDEKDHLFTLSNSGFVFQATGHAWSEVFPGVPPEPRIGHSAMIGLLRAAAGGDSQSLESIVSWIEREAAWAAFNPDGGFRVLEWSTAQPIDNVAPVPALPPYGLLLLGLGVLLVARQFRAPPV